MRRAHLGGLKATVSTSGSAELAPKLTDALHSLQLHPHSSNTSWNFVRLPA